MFDLDLEKLTRVAAEAGLDLGEEELKLYLEQLRDILLYIEQHFVVEN